MAEASTSRRLYQEDSQATDMRWDDSQSPSGLPTSTTVLHAPTQATATLDETAPITPARLEEVPRAPASSGKVRKRRQLWTMEEMDKIRLGIAEFGVGQWTAIYTKYGFPGRTAHQLKDKYRNMLKANII